MESVTFTDNETKYFGDLFTHLDSEGSGIIPVNQVHEFLRASKLSPEVLSQVSRMFSPRLARVRPRERVSEGGDKPLGEGRVEGRSGCGSRVFLTLVRAVGWL